MKKYFLILLLFLALAPLAIEAAVCVPGEVSEALCNPIKGDVKDVPGLIGIILNFFGTLIGGVAIVMVVFSGLRMIVSQGESENVSKAKEAFTWTVVGFILSILAFVIIAAVQSFLSARSVPEDVVNPTNPTIETPIFNPLNAADLKTLINDVMLKNFFGVAGILAVLMLIASGLKYITSNGDDEQASQAKEGIKWSLAGIGVILFAYVIIKAVANFFE